MKRWAKGKGLGYKTCDWHLTFVLFIPKYGMKKNLPEESAMPFLPYAPWPTFYSWCFEALIQSHRGNLISLTSLVFPWPQVFANTMPHKWLIYCCTKQHFCCQQCSSKWSTSQGIHWIKLCTLDWLCSLPLWNDFTFSVPKWNKTPSICARLAFWRDSGIYDSLRWKAGAMKH